MGTLEPPRRRRVCEWLVDKADWLASCTFVYPVANDDETLFAVVQYAGVDAVMRQQATSAFIAGAQAQPGPAPQEPLPIIIGMTGTSDAIESRHSQPDTAIVRELV
jgi:hypothetical protein